MLANFKPRYTGEQLELLNKATCLYSRFKALVFLSECEKSATVGSLEMEMTDIYNNNRAAK